MRTTAFRLRLPERPAMELPVAQFLLRRPRDAAHIARRARVLGALAGLPASRRSSFGKAVSIACRLFVKAGVPATVQFGLSEFQRQMSVEAVVSPTPCNGAAAEIRLDDEDLATLEKLRQALTKLEVNGVPGPLLNIVLAVTTPSKLQLPQQASQWAELLAADNLEDAIATAERAREQLLEELNVARSCGANTDANQQQADNKDLETLSLVVSRASNPILIMDDRGVIQWANEAFATLTGYSEAEAIGQRIDELLFGPSTNPEIVRDLQQALRNGHEFSQDVLQYHRDGRTFWVECKLIPVHDEDGQLTRWIALQTDVTRRRQTEEALRAAKQAAETSSRAKSEFLANMSHEIRTPLNAILGMTELALTTDLTRQQRDYLRTVQSSADTLLQLLNDVLDLSKIEAGKMELEEIVFNLPEAIRETAKALAVSAHEKGIELAVHMPMTIPSYLAGDPTRFRQVLFNLIGNAIKFTERGEVIVEVEEQWRAEDEVCLHFSIRDTGIGIPKDKLQQIFESFTQADSSMARRFGGTGLGLTITSQLLRMMNGKIWVQSKVGQGSVFHFTLPFRLTQQVPEVNEPAEVPELRGKSALIVDDNATNRQILDEMVRHWGMQATLAESAAAAIKALEEASEQGQVFDVVLLDAMMPTVDGFQLAEMIRDRTDLKCGTVMMLSSTDRPNSAARCRQTGIASYLVKPISSAALLEAIAGALKSRRAPAGDHPSSSAESPSAETEFAGNPANPQRSEGETLLRAKPKRSLRVLVADDHEPNRSLAIEILERRGHRCVAAVDGEQAIAAAAEGPFDIVLMDVQMPGRDGFSATREIREREKKNGSHVPIVALTAHALTGDREKCLAAGMDAYLAKPIHARELVALVERVTGVNPNGDHETAVRAGPVCAAPFNISAALHRMDGEMDLLKEHIGYVLHDVPELMERMRSAIATHDSRLLEISAHRLKSLVSSYDHHQARDLAITLELAGKESQFEQAREALSRLEPLIDEFTKAVGYYLQQQSS